jgi:hypothetical protein
MRLDIALQPSRSARIWVCAMALASIGCIVALPLPMPLRATSAALVALSALRTERRLARPSLTGLALTASLRLTLRHADGTQQACRVCGTSRVSPWMVSLVYAPDPPPAGWRRVLPDRALWLLPDAMPAQDWRRLCVLLRWGSGSDGR